MQPFQKTKETKEHFARFSCKVLRACCRCAVLNKVENRPTKTFDKEVPESSYKCNRQHEPDTFRGSDDPNKCFRSLCKYHRLHCNCVTKKKTCKHPSFRGNGQSEGFFAMVMNCCGYIGARTKTHFILSTDLWSGLPYSWGGSRLHNMRSRPRYVIGAFGFVVRLHVQNMN